MKLPQSEKNKLYSQTQDKEYILYMLLATDAQIKEATKQGIYLIKSESELINKLNEKK